jgi:hypothetical protein
MRPYKFTLSAFYPYIILNIDVTDDLETQIHENGMISVLPL